jgi:hypothetical protein
VPVVGAGRAEIPHRLLDSMKHQLKTCRCR